MTLTMKTYRVLFWTLLSLVFIGGCLSSLGVRAWFDKEEPKKECPDGNCC